MTFNDILEDLKDAILFAHPQVVDESGRGLVWTVDTAGVALAGDLGIRPLMAHCHLGLGKLYANIGRRAEARTALSAAVELYQVMEMTLGLPEAEIALA